MVPNKLRIVCSQGDQFDATESHAVNLHADNSNVTVRLEEIFPLLSDALDSDRSWLNDFADDPITITSDLYEVLLAYEHHRRAA